MPPPPATLAAPSPTNPGEQILTFEPPIATVINDTEVRLRSVRILPFETEIITCYDFPTQDAPFWYMSDATVQFEGGPEAHYRRYQYLSWLKDSHCVELAFPVKNEHRATRLIFRVLEFIVPVVPTEVLSEEQIYAANTLLAEHDIEIAPASLEASDGPGGWKFIRKPAEFFAPEQDPGNIVRRVLERPVTGPWEFIVDLNAPEQQAVSSPATATDGPTPDPASRLPPR